MRFMVVMGSCAVGCGVLASMLPGGSNMGELWLQIFVLWLLLLVGGTLVPPLTGLMLTVVSYRDKSIASGLAQIAFNIFG